MASSSSHLTWEYLYATLGDRITNFRKFASQTDNETVAAGLNRLLNSHLGMSDILPRLQSHPILGAMIPQLHMLAFYWWPSKGFHLTLCTYRGRDSFQIQLFHQGDIKEAAVVTLDEVIPTLLDYLSRASAASGEV